VVDAYRASKDEQRIETTPGGSYELGVGADGPVSWGETLRLDADTPSVCAKSCQNCGDHNTDFRGAECVPPKDTPWQPVASISTWGTDDVGE
jgi:hypothetical protein